MIEPRLHFPHDFRKPDYAAVFQHRLDKLQVLRKDPSLMAAAKMFYKDNPIQFIIDWGCTFDPRLPPMGLPATLPFLLFPRQIEFLQFVLRKVQEGAPGVVPKSRDVGISWCMVGLACTQCLFNEGVVVGFGSRKEEYVDKLDSPKSLFYKARMFMRLLPVDFRNGWLEKTDAPFMRLKFPATGSVITGEAGDNIGRGDRTTYYVVDESAHLERPALAEDSLSATTNCRLDVSSLNGPNNPFARKLTNPKIEKFAFSWRDDPRKDEAWYQKQKDELPAVTVAQEIDMDMNASVTGVVIPQAWIQAAVDAHVKLGIKPTGQRRGAMDVADEGQDSCAFAGAHGILLEFMEEWSGKGDDIYGSVEKSHAICHAQGYKEFRYDADGMGAGVRGDSRKINEHAPYTHETWGTVGKAEAMPFRGSGKIVNPELAIPTAVPMEYNDAAERTNEDFFANHKAQGWWDLRVRFQRTYRAVTELHEYDPDSLISLSSRMPDLALLIAELSQPTYTQNGAGKIIINKQPDGSRSPNRGDACMIVFAPSEKVPRSIFDD